MWAVCVGTVLKLTFVLILQEQSPKMRTIEEHKEQEEQSESNAATGRESTCRYVCMKFSLLYFVRYFLPYVMLEIFSGDISNR